MRFRIFAMLSLMVSLSIAVESISAQALFGWLPATTSLILDESNTRPDTLGIRFEFDQPVEGTPPQKPPRLITKILSDGSVIGVSEDPLAGTTDKMWNPGDILRVQMTGGSALIHSKVRQFAEEWTKYANIKFVFGDDPTVFPAGVIRIDFNPDGFSWSVVGRDALGVPFNFSTMHFGWFKDDTPDIEIRAVVLHEFGHALGLIHEHQSPSANIQWDKEKVYALFKAMTPPWDKTKVDQNVFEKYRRSSTNFSQFDPMSIMAYAFPASLTLNGQGIFGNWELSAIDK